MKKYCSDLIVRSVERVGGNNVLLRLTAEDALPVVEAGQFVEVRVPNAPTTFLRRPVSVHFVDYEANELWLLVAVVGEGTRALSLLKAGDKVDCVFPLGNSFSLPKSPSKRFLLVGGGVGIAPLLYLGAKIRGLGAAPTFLLGAKSADGLVQIDEYKRYGRVFVTTEDGSAGERGFVTNHSLLQQERFDFIATCGPKPMMQSVARYAKQEGIACEASLENLMACGLGACLCCVEKTTEGNLCVCKEGPVFNIDKLLWQI